MIQTPKGIKDILPAETFSWQHIERICREVSELFGYQEIRTPILEFSEVFRRGIGEATDVVGKEMYSFIDRGGESLTLRPEMTASVVRSMIQHNYLRDHPMTRAWYIGPMFRYERPQKGRFRQFHSFGAEMFGSAHPEADVELILLASEVYRRCGILDLTLNINSLGNKESRARYRVALVEFLNSIRDDLSSESQMRIDSNPLRVLDSKAPNDIQAVAPAPRLCDYFDQESSDHFSHVKVMLSGQNLPFVEKSTLVRGLDYYSHTVFEFTTTLLGSQDALGGGGRYNNLFEELDGKPTPAVGFGLGLERMLDVMEQVRAVPDPTGTHVTICIAGDDAHTFAQEVAMILRRANISATVETQRRTLKAQLTTAVKNQVRFAIIVGESEKHLRTVQVKNLATAEQTSVDLSDLLNFIRPVFQ